MLCPVLHGQCTDREPAALCCVPWHVPPEPGASARTQVSWQLTWSVLAAHICHRSSPGGMAGESYLLVVTSFAVSLNSDAENSGCSPAPRSVIDVVAAEGRGRSHKKCVLILLCHFFLRCSKFLKCKFKERVITFCKGHSSNGRVICNENILRPR